MKATVTADVETMWGGKLEEISRTSGYASSMEQIQEVLLMVERMLLGQEGEGNQCK